MSKTPEAVRSVLQTLAAQGLEPDHQVLVLLACVGAVCDGAGLDPKEAFKKGVRMAQGVSGMAKA